MSTVLRAYDEFLNDVKNEKTGKAVEASVDSLFYYELPEMQNGFKTKRAVTVWDPLYVMLHGEPSGMEDAIP